MVTSIAQEKVFAIG